eukprot:scaffold32613_cov124-Isochrysis_galbana.AAC.1
MSLRELLSARNAVNCWMPPRDTVDKGASARQPMRSPFPFAFAAGTSASCICRGHTRTSRQHFFMPAFSFGLGLC